MGNFIDQAAKYKLFESVVSNQGNLNDNSHFKFSESENMDLGMQNPDPNMRELEIEYIQAISDSDDITLQASSRMSEQPAPNPKKTRSTLQAPQAG